MTWTKRRKSLGYNCLHPRIDDPAGSPSLCQVPWLIFGRHATWKEMQQISNTEDTVDGRNPANQLRLVVYPIIFQSFIHPRWLFGISSINSMVVLFLIWGSHNPNTLSNKFKSPTPPRSCKLCLTKIQGNPSYITPPQSGAPPVIRG